eukprot:14624110-Ditylum_brightwellii.AAC.1
MNVQISNSIFTAVDNMTTTSFKTTTDGSANDESMSYGWKISTVSEEVIATHAGLTLGDLLSF